MATELYCKVCESVETVARRMRCDGCGRLMDSDEDAISFQLPTKANYFSLCPECLEGVEQAAFEVLVFKCGNCGHYRPEHNRACLRGHCSCPGWVPPEGKDDGRVAVSSGT